MQELRSLPRKPRNLSLARPASDPSLPVQQVGAHRPPGSHLGLFAAARAAGNTASGGKACSSGSSNGSSLLSGRRHDPNDSALGVGGPGSARETAARAEPHQNAKVAPVTSSPSGVSVAFLMSFLDNHCSGPDEPATSRTTRAVAHTLKRRMREVGETGPHINHLAGQTHLVTGGSLAGRASVYLVHAWDADFQQLVEALVADAAGDLDKKYLIDVFGADLHSPPDDPVAAVRRLVAGADEVLLLLDSEGQALQRLWVVFEAFLGLEMGKLRLRCTTPGGFGSTEADLNAWDERIDAADWALADVSRKSDEKRLRNYAEKEWETNGKGTERMLARLKMALRQDVYNEILVAAVEAGDRHTVSAALARGASPEARDTLGNTVESLAMFNGRSDIENLLFEQRMYPKRHLGLSEWALNPQELANSEQAGWFVTEYLTEELGREDVQFNGVEDFFVSGDLLRLSSPDMSEQSTRTPHLSSRGESSYGQL